MLRTAVRAQRRGDASEARVYSRAPPIGSRAGQPSLLPTKAASTDSSAVSQPAEAVDARKMSDAMF
jgi:hypothetical protein